MTGTSSEGIAVEKCRKCRRKVPRGRLSREQVAGYQATIAAGLAEAEGLSKSQIAQILGHSKTTTGRRVLKHPFEPRPYV